MVCKSCGFNNEGNAKFCTSCGAELTAPVAPQPEYVYAQPVQKEQPAKPLAILSLIFAIVGSVLCCCYGTGSFASIAAIIMGAIAKAKGNTSGMAKAGLIIGIINIALLVIAVIIVIIYYVVIVGAVMSASTY